MASAGAPSTCSRRYPSSASTSRPSMEPMTTTHAEPMPQRRPTSGLACLWSAWRLRSWAPHRYAGSRWRCSLRRLPRRPRHGTRWCANPEAKGVLLLHVLPRRSFGERPRARRGKGRTRDHITASLGLRRPSPPQTSTRSLQPPNIRSSQPPNRGRSSTPTSPCPGLPQTIRRTTWTKACRLRRGHKPRRRPRQMVRRSTCGPRQTPSKTCGPRHIRSKVRGTTTMS
mmetsp:Transcript_2614/g.6500  ORF Transcript_2614/g.6500 Transcript_2614/m.6500 type:complete len:227 (-) Transcript_2614:289-969(-)